MVPDAAHRFVADLEAAAYRHQLSDETVVYLLAQVARDVCNDRSLDWSALLNHMQGWREWHGHKGYLTLPAGPGKGGFLKAWSLKRAKEAR